jgi:aminobenzoyl-glutamate transport protein
MSNSNNTEKVAKDSWILKVARMLPESNILFLVLFVLVAVTTFFLQGEYIGVDGEMFVVHNMMSGTGLIWFFYNFIPNFLNFPPLGVIVVGAIGFVFAEKVGLLGTVIKALSLVAPEKALLPIIIIVGLMSSMAADAGYIVLIPLAGALFAGVGKHPLVGIMAAFLGVTAGFGANFLPTPIDAMLGEITAQIAYDAGIPLTVNPVTMNYLFSIGSAIMLTIFLTVIVVKFSDKSVASYEYIVPDDIKDTDMTKLTEVESKGLKSAGIALFAMIALFAVLFATGTLAAQETYIDFRGGFAPLEVARTINPLIDNVIVTMIMLFLIPAIFYGRSTGAIKNHRDYVNLTVVGMKDMAYILVFAIFAGNFLAIFAVSGLAILVADTGASVLLSMNATNTIFIMVMFIMVSAFINMFMGSASAKWNILGPVFIPMLFIATSGVLTPDIVQAAYRVGDASTNTIAPLLTFIGFIILTCKKYVPDFEFGDLMALMLPYSLAVLTVWTIFFSLWLMLGIPFGF